MAQENVINVSYPKKRTPLKIKPLFIVIGIIAILLIIWAVFFRSSSKQDEKPQAEAEKQEESTSSAKPKEATSAANLSGEKVDTSDWYKFEDVEKTFSIKVPKGWFFDKTTKGTREQGKILGGVANFNFIEKEFDQKENFIVYFELDSIDPTTNLKNHATKISCLRATDIIPAEESCQNPSPPSSQKLIKVAEKESVWQEIHGVAGIGLEIYIPKSETEVIVVYSSGMVDKTNGEFKVKQEFVDIVEGMLTTFKLL